MHQRLSNLERAYPVNLSVTRSASSDRDLDLPCVQDEVSSKLRKCAHRGHFAMSHLSRAVGLVVLTCVTFLATRCVVHSQRGPCEPPRSPLQYRRGARPSRNPTRSRRGPVCRRSHSQANSDADEHRAPDTPSGDPAHMRLQCMRRTLPPSMR